MKEITLEILCDLDEVELAQRSQQLSITTLRIAEVEMSKKAAMKEFKDELEGLHKQQWGLSMTVRNRSEVRAVLCRVQFHVPVQGTKRISIKETGELYRDEPMTSQECQSYLFDGSATDVVELADRVEKAGAHEVVLEALKKGVVNGSDQWHQGFRDE